MGVGALSGDSVPLAGSPIEAHWYDVRLAAGVLEPLRVIVPPEATVYGPPALAVSSGQAIVGATRPGHGLSWPAMKPLLVE